MAAAKNKEQDKAAECEVQELELSPATTRTFVVEKEDENITFFQAMRKYRRIVGICLALASAFLLYGYDSVIVGTVSAMPSFLRDFGVQYNSQWIIPSSWLAVWNLASPLGTMVGSLIGGWMQDKTGRRIAMCFASALSAVAVAICYVSYLPASIDSRRGVFLGGKLVQGISIGLSITVTQTYISEILPTVIRGSILTFFPIFCLLGQLAGALVIFGSMKAPKGYATCFLSQFPFSFVPIVVAILLPEPPSYLIRKGYLDGALKAQIKLSPNTNPQAVVARLEKDIDHEKKDTHSTYTECFRRKDLRRTLIVMWANLLPGLFGLPLLAKASYFLQIIGMGANNSVMMLIIGIVTGMLANIASIWILSLTGRRPLIIMTSTVASLLWLSMGISGCTAGPVKIWWSAISLMLIVTIGGLGIWPASYAVGSETSSLHMRAKAQGIGWTVSGGSSAVWGVVLPYIFNPDEGNLRAKTGFVLASACALAAIVTFLIVPEMKGRSVGEIDRMFEVGLRARAFKGWVPPNGESRPSREGSMKKDQSEERKEEV